jgi:xanthine dehydrogenase small subunit
VRVGGLRLRPVNSCIRFLPTLDGKALLTVEDLGGPDAPHPVQQALIDCHGSQCGFCTPGFVMTLAATYEQHQQAGSRPTRQQLADDLAGNLCRCTGYRPIVQAATRMNDLPTVQVDEDAVRQLLKSIRPARTATPASPADYLAPTKLADLLAARSAYPKAQLVAGCTDVGLWINKLHMQFSQIIDVCRVQELRQIERYPHHIAIGAAATLNEAFAALVQDRPELAHFASRFAGMTVRQAGTLGGNVANGSPIGDSMPLLLALGANLVLMRQHRGRLAHREIPLAQFYTGYRKNVLASDEVLAWIKVPKPVAGEFLRAYKISKRFEDDISAVCLAINLRLQGNKVVHAAIGAGGVAATPVCAPQTQALLEGSEWNQANVKRAATCLQAEFQPISDMRASAHYRVQMLGGLMQRFWLESQGQTQVNLESFQLTGAKA